MRERKKSYGVRRSSLMNVKDIKHLAVERIYLVPDTSEGQLGYVWCDDPAPGEGMVASEAVEYVRKDVHDAAIAELERERDMHKAAEEAQIALRQKADERAAALAAHVERMQEVFAEGFESLEDRDYDAWEKEAKSMLASASATSLARRDLIKQAVALEEVQSELYEFPASAGMAMIDHVGDKATYLRRQAEAQQ